MKNLISISEVFGPTIQGEGKSVGRQVIFIRTSLCNLKCIWCKQVGGKLNADHIKPFAYFPELRFAIDNGRTLCKNCHYKTDTYGYKAKLKYPNLKNDF